jgi:hypothetical protein
VSSPYCVKSPSPSCNSKVSHQAEHFRSEHSARVAIRSETVCVYSSFRFDSAACQTFNCLYSSLLLLLLVLLLARPPLPPPPSPLLLPSFVAVAAVTSHSISSVACSGSPSLPHHRSTEVGRATLPPTISFVLADKTLLERFVDTIFSNHCG